MPKIVKAIPKATAISIAINGLTFGMTTDPITPVTIAIAYKIDTAPFSLPPKMDTSRCEQWSLPPCQGKSNKDRYAAHQGNGFTIPPVFVGMINVP